MVCVCNNSWGKSTVGKLTLSLMAFCVCETLAFWRRNDEKHLWSHFSSWHFVSHVYCFHNTWLNIVLCLLILFCCFAVFADLFCCFLAWIKLWVSKGYSHQCIYILFQLLYLLFLQIFLHMILRTPNTFQLMPLPW